MAKVIGIVENMRGKFYIKNSKGNIQEVHNGEQIYEGDRIIPAENTPANATISILPIDSTIPLVLNPQQEQLLDIFLINEDVQASKFSQFDAIQTDIVSDIRDTNWPHIVEYEKIQNDDVIASDTSDGAAFIARDGDSTDIVSDLRKAEWFKPIDEPRYDGNLDNNMNTKTIPTPEIIIKVFASDINGNPLQDSDGNYLGVNEVSEGENTYYVALAFKPESTVFNDTTKLKSTLPS